MPWSANSGNETSISFEPFKIRAVESIKLNTKEYRMEALKKAYYNPFLLKSEDVIIDLLTDSGISAMSTNQLSGMIKADEVYIGSASFDKFHSAVTHLTGYPEVIPAHQGRAAEKILFQALDLKKYHIVISNGFFDTTKYNIGTAALEYPEPKAEDPVASKFRGNMDLEKLKFYLQSPEVYRVALVLVCVTNSHLSGQPVSLKNLGKVANLCRNHNIPLFLDACRYAENVYYVKKNEPEYKDKSLLEISRDMFALADGCFVSMKKDGLCNTGGFLAMKNVELALKCKENIILNEGFPNYGGLTGRDLEAMAVGIMESINEDFLNYHINLVEDFGSLLEKMDIPVVLPTAGYAVYVNASDTLPGIKRSEHPAWCLYCALYIEGGIRACEIGSVMRAPDEREVHPEFVRFSIPRRVYTFAHLQFVADTLKYIMENRDKYSGYQVVQESDILRHISIKLKPIQIQNSSTKSIKESSNLMVKEIDSRGSHTSISSKLNSKRSERDIDQHFIENKQKTSSVKINTKY
ncbi:unnamed protein product [Gordionus sp. m RMFG-2023]